MNENEILASAAKLHRVRPELKPLDWRILGAICAAGQDGLPLAYVRTQPDFFGSLTSFNPAIDRLIAARLIERTEETYATSNYAGRGDRPQRLEVVFKRTQEPVTPYQGL